MEVVPVVVPKVTMPDIQVVVSKKKYDDSLEYWLASVVVKENLIIYAACSEDGIVSGGYKSIKYVACKLDGDTILTCHGEKGWTPADERINNSYREMLADAALVES